MGKLDDIQQSEKQTEAIRFIQHTSDHSLLLQCLIKIQESYLHIPADTVDLLQQQLGLSYAEINAVVEFYSFLSFEKSGDYQILISNNITDQFLGNQTLFKKLNSRLADVNVSIEYTSCTGLCDQGPAILVNGWAINRVDDERIEHIAELIEQRLPVDQWPSHFFEKEDNILRRDIQLSVECQPGAAIKTAIQQGREQSLETLEAAGLKGRGGAGFSTASKWRFCAQTEAGQRYVVCNADEGEPGTFKDRVLLNQYAHDVFEGMTVCAAVIGATRGLVYLRGEYRYLLPQLHQVLQQRRDDGLLGAHILGEDLAFDIDIHLGAGAYICGEESALIESLEGKRGIPRIRPPFPVVSGYLGQPTVVNNVESFWSVSRIMLLGADWFAGVGTDASKGTRLLSISGDCRDPGIYEFPFGVTVTEILAACGGEQTQAIQMAGAAGTTVLARDFERRMCHEDLATGGSFMVIGRQRNLLDMLANFSNFFTHESCGFCTPCRVGTQLIDDIICCFKQGQGSTSELQQLNDIAKLMQQNSFCGLGSSAPTAFLNALQQSPELFSAHGPLDDNPQFDLTAAVAEYEQLVATLSGDLR